jgi:uroporphyrinogen-III synthase
MTAEESGDGADPEPRMLAAVFRPDDGRAGAAADLLEALGAEPLVDPMLAVEPTGAAPRDDADYVVFTSKTGVEIVASERADGGGPDERWAARDATVCAIGETTAAALRERGYDVDRVPAEFSSAGLVEALADEVAGARVEVARSDHGSSVLLAGLQDAGAYVHETVLYRLARPERAGESAERAAAGDLDVALFTSSLTVRHFLAAAVERGVREAAVAGLNDAVVGAIGDPTAETADEAGIEVDVVPDTADFEVLATTVVEDAAPTYHG